MSQRHYENCRTEGWKDNLISKELAMHTCRPELGSPLSRFKKIKNDVYEYICNSSTGGSG